MKVLSVVLPFLIFGNLYGQYSVPHKEMKQELEKLSAHKDVNFNKVQQFYFESEGDSTFLYSSKYLASRKADPKLLNYCLFFRARSAEKKELFSEARSNYLRISKDFKFYQFVLMQLGGVELNSTNYKQALFYFNQLERITQLHPKIGRGVLLNNIGTCYLHLDQFKRAEDYLKQSAELLVQDSTNTNILIDIYMNVANLYYNQYMDDEAIPYFEMAYDLSKSTPDFKLKMDAALNMSIVDENRKDLEKSLVYRKEYDNWKDSLNDQNKVWEIAQLEKKHISEQGKKREQVLQSETKAKVAQRNGFIYSSILLLILLGTGIYFYIQKLRSNRIILAQKKELGILNATKDRLFSVVSHDLRSNVNGLRLSNSKLTKHLEEENYAELREIVRSNGSIANSTYSLLDNLLNWAMIQTEQLYFNIESVNCYSVVDQVSFNYFPLMEEKGISFENSVSRQLLVQADLDSLKIILRNLIDNAIKYSSENGSITVSARDLSDNRCEIIIEDKGNGMSEKAVEALLKPSSSNEVLGNGLGLQLCRELIEKNNGKLTVQSNVGEGTKMGVILQKSA